MVVFKQKKYQTIFFWVWDMVNMVCFVFEYAFFCFELLFFNSSLMVSHFNMVVFKQKKYQKTHIFILGIWFLTSIWLVLNKKNIRKHTFLFWEYGFSLQHGCF